MQAFTRLASLALLSAAPWAASAGTVVYAQAWDDVAKMVASQAGIAQAFDNFSLAQDTRLTDLHWTGYFLNPAQVFDTDFVVEIRADDVGQPGAAPLVAWTVSPLPASPVSSVIPGVLAYRFDAELPSAFDATAGTTYWLSIMATTPSPPQWSWAPGTGGDGVSFQRNLFFANDPLVRREWDLAFSLTTDRPGVPEPASLALAAGALLAALGARARTRRP